MEEARILQNYSGGEVEGGEDDMDVDSSMPLPFSLSCIQDSSALSGDVNEPEVRDTATVIK